ncbi:hypothetical protein ACFYSQ_43515, partial [Streptomyces sp. NPDC006285]
HPHDHQRPCLFCVQGGCQQKPTSRHIPRSAGKMPTSQLFKDPANGPARKIRLKDADAHQLAPDENSQEIAEINLNAAGFVHTFRLLEGIAADGKGWIERTNPSNLPSFRIDG